MEFSSVLCLLPYGQVMDSRRRADEYSGSGKAGRGYRDALL